MRDNMMIGRKAKKTKILLILVLLAAILTACGTDGGNDTDNENGANDSAEMQLSAPVKIAALNGPTGMGMASLMEQPKNYEVTIYQSPDEVIGKVITGEVDAASVPSNLASVLYHKTNGQIQLISVNTLGVLYLVENGETISALSDLKGKTILASGQGGAPEYILKRLLMNAGMDPEKDVAIRWLANHADVTSTLMAEQGSIALLPEPFVTVATGKLSGLSVAADLNDAWQEAYGTGLPMGVFLVQKSFIEKRQADLDILMRDYQASVDFVNTEVTEAAELIVKHGIIADPHVAEAAIPKCNIVLYTGDEGGSESKAMLEQFYELLFEMEPKSVGGQIPDEAFYYLWETEQ